MTVIKRARRTAGTILRGLSNLMTGNYFKRLEQRLARLEVIVKDTDKKMKGLERILENIDNRIKGSSRFSRNGMIWYRWHCYRNFLTEINSK
jgi:hypothetical protein